MRKARIKDQGMSIRVKDFRALSNCAAHVQHVKSAASERITKSISPGNQSTRSPMKCVREEKKTVGQINNRIRVAGAASSNGAAQEREVVKKCIKVNEMD